MASNDPVGARPGGRGIRAEPRGIHVANVFESSASVVSEHLAPDFEFEALLRITAIRFSLPD